MDLTGNLRFTHDLYLLFVAFFSNVTLISVYFKFSRHVTGPFADPFFDLLTIFVLKTQGSSVIFCPSCLCFLGLATCVCRFIKRAMSTGQEPVTPQKPSGGGSVALSPATLSPVSEGGFLTTIKALSR